MGLLDTLRGEGQFGTRTSDKPKSRPTLRQPPEQILRGQADAKSTAVTATPLEAGEKGVQHGGQGVRPAAEVTHGARDANKQPEAPLKPERIPSTLSAPVRALAQRVLAPDEVWTGTPKAVSQDMKDAIRALSSAEQRTVAQGPYLPEVVSVAGEDVPVWQYIGQCVDAVSTGTIHNISSTLDALRADPQLAPLVPRIVALHVAQIFLSHPDVKNASKNLMGVPTMNVDYYKQSDPAFIAKLQAVAEYVRTHPDAGALVNAFFGYQTPLLGALNPARQILKYCGIT